MRAREVEKDEDSYEEYLNDAFGDVEACGMKFGQGTILRELDPTAFRCSLSDEPIEYECGECASKYDSEDEAEGCCKEE